MDVKAILREQLNGDGLRAFGLKGCIDMYRATGDGEYREAALQALNSLLSPEGELRHTALPDIAFVGKALLFGWTETENERFKTEAGKVRDMLRASDLTTPLGLYATRPFIVEYDTRFGDKQSYKAVARQFELAVHNEPPFYLRAGSLPEDKALCSLERAGYMLMALVDTAEKMDMQIYEHYRTMIDSFLEIVRELLPYRKHSLFSAEITNADGEPDAAGNAMIVYALLKGVRLGLLDEEKYLPIARQMIHALNACRGWEHENPGLALMTQAEIQEVENQ